MTVFTPRTLAARWECSEQHIRNMLDRGELPAFRLGGKLLRIRGDDVEAFECKNGASADTAGSSSSSANSTESELDDRSALTTRLRLSAMRQRHMQN
ncbi:helix-turn-helix domain-containing protein [Aureimonas sp. ME7]|uniref:helix-turn-helix domain-containing protein n=1 Tax=Aureimonas sp. ME7 TaxID=2744252 RepID=UPI0015F9D78C|nr:helix-turn-helix domain-containing protein [Aureimonas sp. ME7]